MRNRKLRVGVVGAGHLGSIHSRLLQSIDDVEFAGIVDPVADTRRKIAGQYNTFAFDSHRKLIGQADAAIIAAPTEHHYWIGMELLEAGLHLLVEKPLALTAAEADAMAREAAKRKRILQVGHVERFNPAFTAVAEQIERPRYIEATRASGYTFRSVDVGVVLDLMIHDIDLVLSLVDSEVTDVDAVGGTVFGPHEDMAQAWIRFANGCVANLKASRTSFQAQRNMNIYTEQLFAGVDFADCSARIVRPSKQIANRELDVTRLTADEKTHIRDNLFTEVLPLEEIQVERRNAILDEQHDFVISIRSEQKPQVTGEQARDALDVAERILEAIERSNQRRATDLQTAELPYRKAG